MSGREDAMAALMQQLQSRGAAGGAGNQENNVRRIYCPHIWMHSHSTTWPSVCLLERERERERLNSLSHLQWFLLFSNKAGCRGTECTHVFCPQLSSLFILVYTLYRIRSCLFAPGGCTIRKSGTAPNYT